MPSARGGTFRQAGIAPIMAATAPTGLESRTLPTPDKSRSTLRSFGRGFKTALVLLVLVVLTLVVLILLRPLREWWFSWVANLPGLVRFVLSLVWISVVALIVAGLLAPLETLGWWAGWYDDDIDTTVNSGELAQPLADATNLKRFVVYLDGIGKSTFEYLPDIEEFLDTLAPTLSPRHGPGAGHYALLGDEQPPG